MVTATQPFRDLTAARIKTPSAAPRKLREPLRSLASKRLVMLRVLSTATPDFFLMLFATPLDECHD